MLLLASTLAIGCEKAPPPAAEKSAKAAPPAVPAAVTTPRKVDVIERAMGTEIHLIAYTSPETDEPAVRGAMRRALAEIRRLESLMTTWRDDSEIARVNQQAGSFVKVSPETLEVVEKSLWAGKLSEGTFDISFEVMGGVWKFGDAAEDKPTLPSEATVNALRKHIDFRKIEVDAKQSSVRIGKQQKIGLGGIAKGYAVDRAAKILIDERVGAFLVQAGGDLYGRGRKPDGSPWVSGIRDPRGPADRFFATIELEDHAFSTAGDYARSFVLDGRRYHHIIDPRTGWPATACRSVTVWAKDAHTADAIDDAVFILGAEKGLELVESLPDVGAVIVDDKNAVHVSARLKDKVKLLRPPTDAI